MKENLSNNDLLREPIKNDPDYMDYPGKPESRWSPDGKYRVIYSHIEEISMMEEICLFSLADKNHVIEPFEPLVAIPYSCCWSPDSKYFIIAIYEESPFYFIWNIQKECFALVRLYDLYPTEVEFLNNSEIVIRVMDDQFEAANSEYVFEGDKAQYPVRRYKKPQPLKLQLIDLTFFEKLNFENILELLEAQEEYHQDLIEDGFFPFDGEVPSSTVQEFNGRTMEVFHLEAFAEYGDELSRQWSDEINKKTNGDYDPYVPVSHYIGKKERRSSTS